MKYLFLLPLLAFTLFSSCKKEETQASTSQIEFGNTANMTVQQFNKTIYSYNQDSVAVDVNNNGTDDFKFVIHLTSSGSAKDEIWVKLYSPSQEITMNGFFIPDTTYYNQSTSIVTDSNSNKVWVTSTSNLNCFRTSPNDIMGTIKPSNFKISYYNGTETMSSNGTFNSTFDFPLWQIKSGGTPNVTSTTIDTTFLSQTRYGLNCHDMGMGVKYIGFKINSTQKLGWIKLEPLTNTSLKLYEVAIEL